MNKDSKSNTLAPVRFLNSITLEKCIFQHYPSVRLDINHFSKLIIVFNINANTTAYHVELVYKRSIILTLHLLMGTGTLKKMQWQLQCRHYMSNFLQESNLD